MKCVYKGVDEYEGERRVARMTILNFNNISSRILKDKFKFSNIKVYVVVTLRAV